MKRSLSGFWGLAGSNRISAKNNAAVRSAIEQQLVGWPLAASDVDFSESIRSWVAMFVRAGISVERSRGMAAKHIRARPRLTSCSWASRRAQDARELDHSSRARP